MLQSQQIKELRTNGKLVESLEIALQDLEQNPDNIYAKRNISWVYNAMLKNNVDHVNIQSFILNLEKIRDLELPETETMLADNLAWKIGMLLFSIAKRNDISVHEVETIIQLAQTFNYSKPSEAYSFLLKAFHKALKTNRDLYLSTIRWWDLVNLRKEDFDKDVLPDGKQVMSIAEQVYTAYYKFLIPSNENSLNREEVIKNTKEIDVILEKLPEFLYLMYFKAQMLLSINERELLKETYLPFAQKKSREFWVWDLMSQIVESEEEKLTCLCQACKMGKGVEQMKTGLYLKMAKYFLDKNMFSESKTELLKIKRIKEEHQQKIPSEVLNLLSSPNIKDAIENSSNIDFYRSKTKDVDSILFSNVPAQNIFVSFINQEKKIINFITADNQMGFFKHDKINPNLRIKVGDILSVRFFQFSTDSISKLFTLKEGNDLNLKEKFLKYESDILKVNPKGFGFLNDVYFSKKEIEKNNFVDGDELTIMAIKQHNKKKANFSWNFFRLLSKTK